MKFIKIQNLNKSSIRINLENIEYYGSDYDPIKKDYMVFIRTVSGKELEFRFKDERKVITLLDFIDNELDLIIGG